MLKQYSSQPIAQRFLVPVFCLLLAACATPDSRPSQLPTTMSTVASLVPATPLTVTITRPLATPLLPTRMPSPSKTPTATSLRSPTPTFSPTPSITPTPTRIMGAEGIIGDSFAGRPIVSYQFGNGPHKLLFVGGIHGGYEWNTILLAYELIDHFINHPDAVPSAVTLYIIPVANPDGLFAVTGQTGRFAAGDVSSNTVPGRFNGRGVDLNRNWDCQWRSTAIWGSQSVSGGSHPFSEPETQALRDFFIAPRPALVLFWHSAANGVYAGGCPDPHPPSLEMATLYGLAASYQVHDHFMHYPVTGDAADWLTTQAIPSISVELPTHETLDWSQNLAGITAILDYFSSRSRDLEIANQ